MISTSPPSGFRDFLGFDASRRQLLQHTIAKKFESFGYLPLETPALENLSVLQGSGGGEENEKLIFKVMKRGAKWDEAVERAKSAEKVSEEDFADFGLRFDMTVPLARCVAEYRGQIKLPWKVFHIGPVWRAERAQKGRFREFFQCDVDVIGSPDLNAEWDVLMAGLSAVAAVTDEKFSLHLNHRQWLRSLALHVGWPESRIDEFAILLDKKDKIPAEKLLEEFVAILGKQPPLLEKILASEFSLTDASQMFESSSLHEIQTLVDRLQQSLPSQLSVVFDPSLARGLGYYTGPIFELRHASAGYSLGGGGRYDNLIGRFTKESLPAVGFSLGFERLLLLLESKSKQNLGNRILVAIMDEDRRSFLAELAEGLRRQGEVVSVYPAAAKWKKQMSYASESQFTHVIFQGSDENARGVVKLKRLLSGTEVEVAATAQDLRRAILEST